MNLRPRSLALVFILRAAVALARVALAPAPLDAHQLAGLALDAAAALVSSEASRDASGPPAVDPSKRRRRRRRGR